MVSCLEGVESDTGQVRVHRGVVDGLEARRGCLDFGPIARVTVRMKVSVSRLNVKRVDVSAAYPVPEAMLVEVGVVGSRVMRRRERGRDVISRGKVRLRFGRLGLRTNTAVRIHGVEGEAAAKIEARER